MFTYSAFGHSDQGRTRSNNEDFFLIDRELGLLVLCDGVGGGNAGEKASALCAQTIQEGLRAKKSVLQNHLENPSPSSRAELKFLLQSVMQSANDAILNCAKSAPENEGMATTTEVLLFLKDCALLGHVGDSRTYLIRAGSAHQLTEDHKFGAEMIKKGVWDEKTAAKSPFSNTLTRAMGNQPVLQPDLLEIEIAHGDLFLMCSDGFSDYFNTTAISAMISGRTPEELPSLLVQQANNQGGKDNITTLVAAIEPPEETKESNRPLAIEVLRKQQALGKVGLFGYLTFAELSKVLAVTQVRTLGPGETLFKEGDVSDEMFVVVSGKVEVLKEKQSLAILKQGAPLGEMGIVDKSPRSATVRAVEPTTILSISRKDIISLLKQEPVIGVKFLWAMSQELDRRLRSTTRDLAEARAVIEKAQKTDLPFHLE